MISESKCSAYLIVPWLGRTETDFLNCPSKAATNTKKHDRILFFSSSLFFCFFLHRWHSFTFVFSFVSAFDSVFMLFSFPSLCCLLALFSLFHLLLCFYIRHMIILNVYFLSLSKPAIIIVPKFSSLRYLRRNII